MSALDFSMATPALSVLHGWESVVREARRLTPPALLRKLATTEAEVEATCQFHLAHLEWSYEQDWFKDFADEVNEIYGKGIAANKKFIEQPRRIPCPTDDCDKMVVIDAENLSADVTCRGCGEARSTLRLVALAVTVGRQRLGDFMSGLAPVQAVAASTQSSLATLPAMLMSW